MSAKIRSQWFLIFPALLLRCINLLELPSPFHEAVQVFVEGGINRSEELGSTRSVT